VKLNNHFSIDIYFRKYSLAHEKDIVECVVKHGAYDLVKGTALWKMMEEKKVKQSTVNVKSEIRRNAYTDI
jgi:hypothetical protein